MGNSGKNINQVLMQGTYSEGIFAERINLKTLTRGQYIIKAEIGDSVSSKIVDIIQE